MDLAGNTYSSSITVTPTDAMPPVITDSQTIDSKTLYLTFSEPLNNTVLADDFIFYSSRKGSIYSLPVQSVSYSNNKVTITLSSAAVGGDDIHYTIKANSHISDLSSNSFNGGVAFSGLVNNNIIQIVISGSYSSDRSSLPVTITPTVTTIKAGTTGSGSSIKVDGEVLGVSTFRFMKDLSLGQTSKDVKELQKKLITDGFLNISTSSVTGYFGPQTLKAVKAYQKFKHLPVSGLVGPDTRAALNGEAYVVIDRATQIKKLWAQLQAIKDILDELIKTGVLK
jgi:hypothetical protein